MSDTSEKAKLGNIVFEDGIPILAAKLGEVQRKQAEAEDRDRQYKADQLTLNRRLVYATVALVIATVALGTFQIWYMHRQWKLTSASLSQIGDQIWAAKDAANAAQDAAETARTTLERSSTSFKQETRAYVSPTNALMSSPPTCPDNLGLHICADIHYANSGKTPAVGVRCYRYASFGDRSEADIKALEVPLYAKPDGSLLGNVPERDQFGTAFTRIVDQTTGQKLIDGDIPIVIYGVIQYFDIFGDYHETGFCYERVHRSTAFISCTYGTWFERENRPTYIHDKK